MPAERDLAGVWLDLAPQQPANFFPALAREEKQSDDVTEVVVCEGAPYDRDFV